MAIVVLSHTFHKQVTNVSLHVFVAFLWGILTFSLTGDVKIYTTGSSQNAAYHMGLVSPIKVENSLFLFGLKRKAQGPYTELYVQKEIWEASPPEP